MFPIGDERFRGGPVPLVTVALIALNVLAFLLELNQPSPRALQSFITAWGVVPREYTLGRDLAPSIPSPYWTTLLTSMFLHGGWLHLGGNMLYLWIFGDNIEKLIGHIRYVLFYLLCGVAAAVTHIALNTGSAVPVVGASGAISGILGGYLVQFPTNRVFVLTYGRVAAVPAYVLLLFWILIQFVNGIGAMATTPATVGVAFMAHVGGFVAGVVLIKIFAAGRSRYALA